MKKLLLTVAVAGLAFSLTGCDEKKTESVKDAVNKAADATKDAANKTGDALKEGAKDLKDAVK